MAILKVALLGNPVLRGASREIVPDEIRSTEIQRLLRDMVETMRDYDGVGLAANQVYEARQIAVLEVAENPRYPDKPKVPLSVLVNPKINAVSEEVEEDWEGCLSVPELRGKVPRYKTIRVFALDATGKELDFIASGFHARVIQHEWDHLHGKVYLDRMRDFSTLAHLREFGRYWLNR